MMRWIGKLAGLAAKLAALAAGVVIAMEALDLLRERERSRYIVDKTFTD